MDQMQHASNDLHKANTPLTDEELAARAVVTGAVLSRLTPCVFIDFPGNTVMNRKLVKYEARMRLIVTEICRREEAKKAKEGEEEEEETEE